MAIRKPPMAAKLWINIFFINTYYLQTWVMLNGKDVQLTAFTFLNRRTLNTSIRTINTTFSLFGFKIIFAMRTFPNILTIIGWHLFSCFLMTLWTCDCWLELNVSHILKPETRIKIVFSYYLKNLKIIEIIKLTTRHVIIGK